MINAVSSPFSNRADLTSKKNPPPSFVERVCSRLTGICFLATATKGIERVEKI
jgi:hypothetical protein